MWFWEKKEGKSSTLQILSFSLNKSSLLIWGIFMRFLWVHEIFMSLWEICFFTVKLFFPPIAVVNKCDFWKKKGKKEFSIGNLIILIKWIYFFLLRCEDTLDVEVAASGFSKEMEQSLEEVRQIIMNLAWYRSWCVISIWRWGVLL